MKASSTLRLALACLSVIILGGLAITLVQLADTALSLQERLQRLPAWAAWPLAVLLIGLGLAMVYLVWRLLKPAKVQPPAPRVLSSDALLERANRLQQNRLPALERPANAPNAEQPVGHAAPLTDLSESRGSVTEDDYGAASLEHAALSQAVRAEVDQLEARAHTQSLYVALFGEISAGKSSLIQALGGANPALEVNVTGGTTTQVTQYEVQLPSAPFARLILSDVPGTNEVNAAQRAVLAREEALRAHVVALVVSADLSRSQAAEWSWLQAFNKPVWLILSKIDRYEAVELAQLKAVLKQKFGTEPICVHSSFQEQVEVQDAQGRTTFKSRVRAANIAALTDQLTAQMRRFSSGERESLEQRRSHAVLSSLDLKLAEAEQQQRRVAAMKIVAGYQRKAVIGAMASVAPGTDLFVQGALAVGLVKNLSELYGVPMRQLDIDDLLKWFGGRFKASATILLAVAGNAAKAFPGLGTLGGGVMHAIAYGLIFESIGKALIDCLAALQDRSAGPAALKLDRNLLLAGFNREMQDHKALISRAAKLAQAIWSGEFKNHS